MARTRSPTFAVGAAPSLDQYVGAFCDAPLERGAVMALSKMLAGVIGAQLQLLLPEEQVVVGKRDFGGSKRRHHLDAFVHSTDAGLKLGLDVKGLNAASSVRKNWNNRLGDFHELASNHHGTFARAVLGGVIVVPQEEVPDQILSEIHRAMLNAEGRRAIADSPNLLECGCLVVINKAARSIVQDFPKQGSTLRIEVFAERMKQVFEERWS